MSVSLKIILHSKTYADGTRPVMLQCIKTAATGNIWKRRMICKVKPAQFDKANGRIKNHPNQLLLNATIAEAFTEAERRLLKARLDGREVDPEAIIATAVAIAVKPGFLLQHGWQYIERCRQKGQIHTAEKYSAHVKKLAEYMGKDRAGEQLDIHMDDINEDWMLTWSVWLKKNGTKSANTLHRRMAFMTTLFNDARKRGLTKADPMAFLEFKEQKVRKPKLTLEQLNQMEALELTGRTNDARNTFLMQFFAYGTRISDALTWKKSDIRREGDVWYLHYTSMKTGDLIDVRLNEKAKAIIRVYLDTVPGPFLLPWLQKHRDLPNLSDEENKGRLISQIESKTYLVNRELKTIAEKAGWEGLNLSTHIARHTFATLADEKISDKRKISAALGHARFSTTEIYLAELRQSDVNDAIDELWR